MGGELRVQGFYATVFVSKSSSLSLSTFVFMWIDRMKPLSP